MRPRWLLRAGGIRGGIRLDSVHRETGLLGAGCPNVGGICIGCTMPGFPDKFMPFMNQPPGSLLSSNAVATYGRAIHALRRFTQASLNKEPSWRGQDQKRN